MRKKLEHGLKAVVHDGQTVSVVQPRTYASRLMRFLSGVFVPSGGSGGVAEAAAASGASLGRAGALATA
jgi:hypothetical protein